MFRSLDSWLRHTSGRGDHRGILAMGVSTSMHSRSEARWRPTVEPLEDRFAPATLTVNTTADNTDSNAVLTLREAIHLINEAGNAQTALGRGLNAGEQNQITGTFGNNDTIVFSSSLNNQAITLGSLLPELKTTLAINGPGQNLFALDGADQFRILFVQGAANLSLSNITIQNGRLTAGGNGAGIRNNGTLSVTNVTFTGNDVADDGGALFSSGSAISTTITNSTFTNNTAANSGGAILVNSNLTITGSTFSNNHATTASGGAIFVGNNSTTTITNTTFTNNSAGNFGGGIRSEGSAVLSITSSSITNNSAASSGGGVFSGGELTVSRSTISQNTSGGGAGGLYTGKPTTIDRSTISGNAAQSGSGGGIYLDDSTLTITNSTISGNTAAVRGGGIRNTKTLVVLNSTITLNAADSDNNSVDNSEVGGGIHTSDAQSTQLFNTIVAGNFINGAVITNPSISSDDIGGASVDLTVSANNLISDPVFNGGLTHGNLGNIVGNGQGGLLFVNTVLDMNLQDNGGPTFTHALVQNSPAIGAGSKSVAGYSPYDQRGAARDANAPDIGAFEVHHPLAPVGVPITYAETFLPKPSANANEAFVKGLYQSTLLRGGDAGGIGFWVGRLNAGVSRFDVAFGFVNSNENRRNQVTFFYRYFLDRTADEGGLNFHVQRLLSGVDEGEVMTGFVLSNEFSGQNTNEQFVNLMYYALLGRQADAGGFNYWMNQLSSGARTRGGVVPDFLRANETIDRVTNAFAGSYIKREIDAFSQTNLRNASKAGATFGNLAAQILALDEFFAAAGNNL